MKHIVKRMGRKELFDQRKIYASCYSACLTTHMKRVEAEKICDKVCKDMRKWIRNKKQVTSNQIFRETTKSIRKYDKKVAFMYGTHRDVS